VHARVLAQKAVGRCLPLGSDTLSAAASAAASTRPPVALMLEAALLLEGPI